MIELVVRLVVSLAIVVGLLMLITRLGGRRFRGSTGSLVSILHRQQLSRTTSVAVVTVGQRVLVLGATDHTISVLAELDPDELPEPAGASPMPMPSQRRGALSGSALSPQTWKQALAAASARHAGAPEPIGMGDAQ